MYSHLWQTYGQSWPVRLSFLLRLLVQIAKFVALPIALSQIIAGLSDRDFDHAQAAVLVFVGISVVIAIITPLVKYIGVLGENKVYEATTAAYFSRLINIDMDYFHSNLSGYLTTATRQYVDGCIQLVRVLRANYLPTVLSILFPLVVIAWIDIQLGLVTLALCAVMITYLLWSSKIIDPYRTRSRELYKKNSGRIADIISNILAVRSAAQESVYIRRVRREAHREAKVFERRYVMQARLVALREFFTVTFFLALLWLTVQRMSAGHFDLAAAVLVVTYTTTILSGVYALSEDIDTHDDWVDKIIPAFEILNRQNTIADPVKPQSLGHVRGEISFNNVAFSYENNDQSSKVFYDFSLHIPAGQKVGIVGLSGAGKSTLAKLLLRFNDVQKGLILLDKTDIRDITQADLRRQMSYVPQEPLLMHTTIRENVLLAKPDATEKEIIAALKAAHAWEFVRRLPGGIDTIVGERGVKLSGGQKQRIAIARAVLHHAPIMILDEATSALDSESEQIIKNSFATILHGKTAIVVAHRLSTLSEMDRIVVIDSGNIIEDGTHRQLLANKGTYAQLWHHQQKGLEE